MVAFSVATFTFILSIPSNLLTTLSIAFAQDAQVIPPILKSTLLYLTSSNRLYPAFFTTDSKSSNLTVSLSYSILIFSVAIFTLWLVTPSIFFTARSTDLPQAEHVIPVTL
ncbi:hypothetical protein SDC9_151391 [bioreactor metagenome]|uniref:Uncharacterized protein n=1 Tax=bioreactor metagenome TaxID=1076179 RepID=A0A645EQ59_9ZZZZ